MKSQSNLLEEAKGSQNHHASADTFDKFIDAKEHEERPVGDDLMSLSRKDVQRFLIKSYEEPTRDQMLVPVLSLSVEARLYLDFQIKMF